MAFLAWALSVVRIIGVSEKGMESSSKRNHAISIGENGTGDWIFGRIGMTGPRNQRLKKPMNQRRQR